MGLGLVFALKSPWLHFKLLSFLMLLDFTNFVSMCCWIELSVLSPLVCSLDLSAASVQCWGPTRSPALRQHLLNKREAATM